MTIIIYAEYASQEDYDNDVPSKLVGEGTFRGTIDGKYLYESSVSVCHKIDSAEEAIDTFMRLQTSFVDLTERFHWVTIDLCTDYVPVNFDEDIWRRPLSKVGLRTQPF